MEFPRRLRSFLSIESSFSRLVRPAVEEYLEERLERIRSLTEHKEFGRARAHIEDLDLLPVVEPFRDRLEMLGVQAVMLGAQHHTEIENTFLYTQLKKKIPVQAQLGVDHFIYGIGIFATEELKRRARNLLTAHQSNVLKIVNPKTPEALGAALNSFVLEGGQRLVDMNANVVTSKLISFGFMQQAMLEGKTSYQITAVLDRRTCDVCKSMHGKIFEVASNMMLIEDGLTSSPGTLKSVNPWPKHNKAAIEELKLMNNQQIQQRGWALPPYHPMCRCTLVDVGTVTNIVPGGTPTPPPELLMYQPAGPQASTNFALNPAHTELPDVHGDAPKVIENLGEAKNVGIPSIGASAAQVQQITDQLHNIDLNVQLLPPKAKTIPKTINGKTPPGPAKVMSNRTRVEDLPSNWGKVYRKDWTKSNAPGSGDTTFDEMTGWFGQGYIDDRFTELRGHFEVELWDKYAGPEYIKWNSMQRLLQKAPDEAYDLDAVWAKMMYYADEIIEEDAPSDIISTALNKKPKIRLGFKKERFPGLDYFKSSKADVERYIRELLAMEATIDSGVHTLPRDVTMYRGARYNPVRYNNLEVGSVFNDASFGSWSTSRHEAAWFADKGISGFSSHGTPMAGDVPNHGIVFRRIARKGERGMWMYVKEDEWIAQPNQMWRIVRVEKAPDWAQENMIGTVTFVDVEAVDDPKLMQGLTQGLKDYDEALNKFVSKPQYRPPIPGYENLPTPNLASKLPDQAIHDNWMRQAKEFWQSVNNPQAEPDWRKIMFPAPSGDGVLQTNVPIPKFNPIKMVSNDAWETFNGFADNWYTFSKALDDITEIPLGTFPDSDYIKLGLNKANTIFSDRETRNLYELFMQKMSALYSTSNWEDLDFDQWNAVLDAVAKATGQEVDGLTQRIAGLMNNIESLDHLMSKKRLVDDMTMYKAFFTEESLPFKLDDLRPGFEFDYSGQSVWSPFPNRAFEYAEALEGVKPDGVIIRTVYPKGANYFGFGDGDDLFGQQLMFPKNQKYRVIKVETSPVIEGGGSKNLVVTVEVVNEVKDASPTPGALPNVGATATSLQDELEADLAQVPQATIAPGAGQTTMPKVAPTLVEETIDEVGVTPLPDDPVQSLPPKAKTAKPIGGKDTPMPPDGEFSVLDLPENYGPFYNYGKTEAMYYEVLPTGVPHLSRADLDNLIGGGLDVEDTFVAKHGPKAFKLWNDYTGFGYQRWNNLMRLVHKSGPNEAWDVEGVWQKLISKADEFSTVSDEFDKTFSVALPKKYSGLYGHQWTKESVRDNLEHIIEMERDLRDTPDLLPRDGVLYRGGEFFPERYADFKVGASFTDDSFGSWTPSRDQASFFGAPKGDGNPGVIFRRIGRKGEGGIWVGGSEREWVTKPNQTYRIVRVEDPPADMDVSQIYGGPIKFVDVELVDDPYGIVALTDSEAHWDDGLHAFVKPKTGEPIAKITDLDSPHLADQLPSQNYLDSIRLAAKEVNPVSDAAGAKVMHLAPTSQYGGIKNGTLKTNLNMVDDIYWIELQDAFGGKFGLDEALQNPLYFYGIGPDSIELHEGGVAALGRYLQTPDLKKQMDDAMHFIGDLLGKKSFDDVLEDGWSEVASAMKLSKEASGELSDQMFGQIKIDRLINLKGLDDDTIMYQAFASDKDLPFDVFNIREGFEYTTEAYSSWSPLVASAYKHHPDAGDIDEGQVLIRTVFPQGQKTLFLGEGLKSGKYKDNFLMPRNLQYRIVSIENSPFVKDGIDVTDDVTRKNLVITVEVLGPTDGKSASVLVADAASDVLPTPDGMTGAPAGKLISANTGKATQSAGVFPQDEAPKVLFESAYKADWAKKESIEASLKKAFPDLEKFDLDLSEGLEQIDWSDPAVKAAIAGKDLPEPPDVITPLEKFYFNVLLEWSELHDISIQTCLKNNSVFLLSQPEPVFKDFIKEIAQKTIDWKSYKSQLVQAGIPEFWKTAPSVIDKTSQLPSKDAFKIFYGLDLEKKTWLENAVSETFDFGPVDFGDGIPNSFPPNLPDAIIKKYGPLPDVLSSEDFDFVDNIVEFITTNTANTDEPWKIKGLVDPSMLESFEVTAKKLRRWRIYKDKLLEDGIDLDDINTIPGYVKPEGGIKSVKPFAETQVEEALALNLDDFGMEFTPEPKNIMGEKITPVGPTLGEQLAADLKQMQSEVVPDKLPMEWNAAQYPGGAARQLGPESVFNTENLAKPGDIAHVYEAIPGKAPVVPAALDDHFGYDSLEYVVLNNTGSALGNFSNKELDALSSFALAADEVEESVMNSKLLKRAMVHAQRMDMQDSKKRSFGFYELTNYEKKQVVKELMKEEPDLADYFKSEETMRKVLDQQKDFDTAIRQATLNEDTVVFMGTVAGDTDQSTVIKEGGVFWTSTDFEIGKVFTDNDYGHWTVNRTTAMDKASWAAVTQHLRSVGDSPTLPGALSPFDELMTNERIVIRTVIPKKHSALWTGSKNVQFMSDTGEIILPRGMMYRVIDSELLDGAVTSDFGKKVNIPTIVQPSTLTKVDADQIPVRVVTVELVQPDMQDEVKSAWKYNGVTDDINLDAKVPVGPDKPEIDYHAGVQNLDDPDFTKPIQDRHGDLYSIADVVGEENLQIWSAQLKESKLYNDVLQYVPDPEAFLRDKNLQAQAGFLYLKEKEFTHKTKLSKIGSAKIIGKKTAEYLEDMLKSFRPAGSSKALSFGNNLAEEADLFAPAPKWMVLNDPEAGTFMSGRTFDTWSIDPKKAQSFAENQWFGQLANVQVEAKNADIPVTILRLKKPKDADGFIYGGSQTGFVWKAPGKHYMIEDVADVKMSPAHGMNDTPIDVRVVTVSLIDDAGDARLAGAGDSTVVPFLKPDAPDLPPPSLESVPFTEQSLRRLPPESDVSDVRITRLAGTEPEEAIDLNTFGAQMGPPEFDDFDDFDVIGPENWSSNGPLSKADWDDVKSYLSGPEVLPGITLDDLYLMTDAALGNETFSMVGLRKSLKEIQARYPEVFKKLPKMFENDGTPTQAAKELKAHFKTVSRAITHYQTTPMDAVFYRPVPVNSAMDALINDDASVGSIFLDRTHGQWSMSKHDLVSSLPKSGQAETTVLRTVIPKASRGLWIGGDFDSIMLDKAMVYKVVSVEHNVELGGRATKVITVELRPIKEALDSGLPTAPTLDPLIPGNGLVLDSKMSMIPSQEKLGVLPEGWKDADGSLPTHWSGESMAINSPYDVAEPSSEKAQLFMDLPDTLNITPRQLEAFKDFWREDGALFTGSSLYRAADILDLSPIDPADPATWTKKALIEGIDRITAARGLPEPGKMAKVGLVNRTREWLKEIQEAIPKTTATVTTKQPLVLYNSIDTTQAQAFESSGLGSVFNYNAPKMGFANKHPLMDPELTDPDRAIVRYVLPKGQPAVRVGGSRVSYAGPFKLGENYSLNEWVFGEQYFMRVVGIEKDVDVPIDFSYAKGFGLDGKTMRRDVYTIELVPKIDPDTNAAFAVDNALQFSDLSPVSDDVLDSMASLSPPPEPSLVPSLVDPSIAPAISAAADDDVIPFDAAIPKMMLIDENYNLDKTGTSSKFISVSSESPHLLNAEPGTIQALTFQTSGDFAPYINIDASVAKTKKLMFDGSLGPAVTGGSDLLGKDKYNGLIIETLARQSQQKAMFADVNEAYASVMDALPKVAQEAITDDVFRDIWEKFAAGHWKYVSEGYETAGEGLAVYKPILYGEMDGLNIGGLFAPNHTTAWFTETNDALPRLLDSQLKSGKIAEKKVARVVLPPQMKIGLDANSTQALMPKGAAFKVTGIEEFTDAATKEQVKVFTLELDLTNSKKLKGDFKITLDPTDTPVDPMTKEKAKLTFGSSEQWDPREIPDTYWASNINWTQSNAAFTGEVIHDEMGRIIDTSRVAIAGSPSKMPKDSFKAAGYFNPKVEHGLSAVHEYEMLDIKGHLWMQAALDWLDDNNLSTTTIWENYTEFDREKVWNQLKDEMKNIVKWSPDAKDEKYLQELLFAMEGGKYFSDHGIAPHEFFGYKAVSSSKWNALNEGDIFQANNVGVWQSDVEAVKEQAKLLRSSELVADTPVETYYQVIVPGGQKMLYIPEAKGGHASTFLLPGQGLEEAFDGKFGVAAPKFKVVKKEQLLAKNPITSTPLEGAAPKRVITLELVLDDTISPPPRKSTLVFTGADGSGGPSRQLEYHNAPAWQSLPDDTERTIHDDWFTSAPGNPGQTPEDVYVRQGYKDFRDLETPDMDPMITPEQAAVAPLQYTMKEAADLVSYTGTGFSETNSTLRHLGEKAITVDNLTARFMSQGSSKAWSREKAMQLKARFDELDTMMGKHGLQSDLVTYRGVAAEKPGLYNNYKVGSTFTEDGYWSSSYNKEIAWNFSQTSEVDGFRTVFRMVTPKGTKGLFVGGYEFEVIMPRKTRFKIVNVTEKKGYFPEGFASYGTDKGYNVRFVDIEMVQEGFTQVQPGTGTTAIPWTPENKTQYWERVKSNWTPDKLDNVLMEIQSQGGGGADDVIVAAGIPTNAPPTPKITPKDVTEMAEGPVKDFEVDSLAILYPGTQYFEDINPAEVMIEWETLFGKQELPDKIEKISLMLIAEKKKILAMDQATDNAKASLATYEALEEKFVRGAKKALGDNYEHLTSVKGGLPDLPSKALGHGKKFNGELTDEMSAMIGKHFPIDEKSTDEKWALWTNLFEEPIPDDPQEVLDMLAHQYNAYHDYINNAFIDELDDGDLIAEYAGKKTWILSLLDLMSPADRKKLKLVDGGHLGDAKTGVWINK